MTQLAALKILSAYTKERYDELREQMLAELAPGDRRVVRSPLDGKTRFGEIYRTDPKDVPVVTDKDAFTAWMATNYRKMTETFYEVIGTDEQVKAVLFEHAPTLLKLRRRVTQKAQADLLDESKIVGQTIGPGGEVDVPGVAWLPNSSSYVACKPAKDADLAMFEARAAGALDLDAVLHVAIAAPIVEPIIVEAVSDDS